MGAVAAGEVAGADGLLPAVVVAQPAGGLLVGGIDVDQLDAALDRHPSQVEVLAEDAFGLGLGQEQQERVGGVGDADVEQPQGGHPTSNVDPQLHGPVAERQQRRSDPKGGEDFEGAGLDGQRP